MHSVIRPVYLSLGSNLGSREECLRSALRRLDGTALRLKRVSSLYSTEPVDVTDQPAFLNLVCEGETELGPSQLLRTCLEVEKRMGRIRTVPGGPREIDVDILFLGGEIVSLPGLQIPHPRLYRRRFVLVPLQEIAPDFRDPVTGRTVVELVKSCLDRSKVRRLFRRDLPRRGGGTSDF